MPREKRKGEYGTLYAELPIELLKYLKDRAGRHNRTKTGELVQILSDLRTIEEATKDRGKKR